MDFPEEKTEVSFVAGEDTITGILTGYSYDYLSGEVVGFFLDGEELRYPISLLDIEETPLTNDSE